MASLLPRQKLHPSQQAPNKTVPPFVLGRAPWWVPTVPAQRRDGKRKISFAEALKDFLQNVSFHCYGKLVEPHRRFHEHFFWIIFHITMMSILVVFLCSTSIFEGQFLSTTMYDPLYPIYKVAFPTLSICTLNRMSNASVTRYAEELQSKDPYKRGVDYFYKEIRKLSYPYSQKIENYDNFEKFLEFQNFLDIYDTKDTEVFYNTRDRMKKLTPSCKDVLVRCRLAGEDFDCLTKFTETLTANGFCCTFNEDGLYSKPRRQSFSFYEEVNGLVLLLNSSNNDGYFKISPSAGFKNDPRNWCICRPCHYISRCRRHIFIEISMYFTDLNYVWFARALNFYINSYGYYADVKSGSVKERYVESGMYTYLSINPGIIETVNEARILSPSVRKCYFDDEQARIFGKQYSANNCITRCRIFSILVLCNCVLFMHPEDLLDVSTDFVYCTLRHKACLERYYFKWSNVITERANIPGLEREMEDSLYCPQCLPLCTSESYDVYAKALPLTSYNTHTFPEITEENIPSLALTNVYFGVSHIQIFRRILKDTWFEVLSYIGNIVSIITGFSLVGVCEVLYFICRQLFLALRSEMASDRKVKKQKAKTALIIMP